VHTIPGEEVYYEPPQKGRANLPNFGKFLGVHPGPQLIPQLFCTFLNPQPRVKSLSWKEKRRRNWVGKFFESGDPPTGFKEKNFREIANLKCPWEIWNGKEFNGSRKVIGVNSGHTQILPEV